MEKEQTMRDEATAAAVGGFIIGVFMTIMVELAIIGIATILKWIF